MIPMECIFFGRFRAKDDFPKQMAGVPHPRLGKIFGKNPNESPCFPTSPTIYLLLVGWGIGREGIERYQPREELLWKKVGEVGKVVFSHKRESVSQSENIRHMEHSR